MREVCEHDVLVTQKCEECEKNRPKCVWKFNNEDVCEWKTNLEDVYETSCNNMWTFIAGDITDNRAKYCIYCGKLIKEVKE